MRFWDSSGLVLLLTDQPGSQQARELFRSDASMVVWWGSPLECWSALARLRREGTLSSEGEGVAGELLASLLQATFEVQPSDELRRLGIRLLRVHPLRAADALQLAAAITWAGDPPSPGKEMVVFDRRLWEAAHLEGFTVLPTRVET